MGNWTRGFSPSWAQVAPRNNYSSSPNIIVAGGLIPVSLSDPRFVNNTAGTPQQVFTSGTASNLDWIESPTYTDGTQCCNWEGTGTDVFNLTKCRVDWREGPRIGSDSGTMNVDQCFINCVGKTGDHADGMQAFSTGGTGIINITNTCFRSYSDAEAASVYGAGFIGSDAFFWADTFGGTASFNNVLIWGGARGVTIDADATTTVHVSFNNVYFAPSPSYEPWEFFPYSIQATGGTLIIDQWTNVFTAVVGANGDIIIETPLPSP